MVRDMKHQKLADIKQLFTARQHNEYGWLESKHDAAKKLIWYTA
jgi:hypothetical protein